METREIIRHIEEDASLPTGISERFAGYAVIGLPAVRAHDLALRRFRPHRWVRVTSRSGIAILVANGLSIRQLRRNSAVLDTSAMRSKRACTHKSASTGPALTSFGFW